MIKMEYRARTRGVELITPGESVSFEVKSYGFEPSKTKLERVR